MNERHSTNAAQNESSLFFGSCNDESYGPPPFLPQLKRKKRRAKMVFSAPEADLEESLDHNVLSIEDETCYLNVSNLISPSQSLLITSVLEQMQSVMDVNVKTDLGTKTVKISYNPIAISVQTIMKSLQDVGLHARENPSPIEQRQESLQSGNRTLCRSSLHVQGICCPTEVPIIKGIIKKVFKSGIKKISINIPSRMVYVEHDYSSVTVKDIENVLNNEGFGASIKKLESVGVFLLIPKTYQLVLLQILLRVLSLFMDLRVVMMWMTLLILSKHLIFYPSELETIHAT